MFEFVESALLLYGIYLLCRLFINYNQIQLYFVHLVKFVFIS